MLDCCHSGALTERGSRAQPDDLVRDLVSDEFGVVCMCSSLGSESSLESLFAPVNQHTHHPVVEAGVPA